MSIRQKIEDILKEDPNISIGELRNQLPEINPGSLKADFYKLKRKLNGPVPRKTTKSEPKTKNKNDQQQVSETSVDTLQAKFPDIKKKSARQQVNEYLNENTEAKFDMLQIIFPDIKMASLRTYISLWKKVQDPKKEPVEDKTITAMTDKIAKKQPDEKKIKPKIKVKKNKPAKKQLDKPAKEDDELIKSLKRTIAAHEKTINTLSKTLELLSPESEKGELKGMTLSEIKSIAVTYLKSIKELPAKLRRKGIS